MEAEIDPVNNRIGHVVAVWKDLTLVFGGGRYVDHSWTYWSPAVVHCHQDGIWRAEITTGDIPFSFMDERAEVIGDTLYLVKFYEMHRLDLNTFHWSEIEPTGTSPLSRSCCSWVLGEKIFLFGGSGSHGKEAELVYPTSLKTISSQDAVSVFNNQLVYYDCLENTWNWPPSYGEVPSPRDGSAAFLWSDNGRSLAFIMGGWETYEYHNDLFVLDLENMSWQAIRGSTSLVKAGMWPMARRAHSLTMISKRYAILFGGTEIGDCWLLNIRTCTSNLNGGTIWIPCQRQKDILRWKHVAVKEPSTKKVWIIGGWARSNNRMHTDIPDLLELTFNSHQSLKMSALERVTDNLGQLASQITELPAELKLAVKEFGSNLKIGFSHKRISREINL